MKAAARLPLVAAAAMVALLARPAVAQGAKGAQGTSGASGAAGARTTVPIPDSIAKKLPKGPRVPTAFPELFAARDARARAALEYLRCFQGTVDALRSGALGSVPRAWSMTCVRQGKEWRGVFGELTDEAPGIRVHLQYAFRDKGPVVTRDRVDTALVNGTARALLRGLSAPRPGAGQHEFVPIALAQDGYIEVWFVPVPGSPARVVTGGDSLIQMSADGMRELGHARTTPPIRTFAVEPAGSAWTLQSNEERVPLLSELMVAHLALDLVPDVRIRTRQFESAIARDGRAARHTRK